MSLLHRLEAELAGPSNSTSGYPRIEQAMIADARLPAVDSPIDELWALRAALDMGEPVHIALRRIHLALARYDFSRTKAEDKQIQGWVTEPSFDEGAWHAAQAGLWSMMGSHTLAELHEDLAMESANIEGDARLTVLLARAQRVSRSRDDRACQTC